MAASSADELPAEVRQRYYEGRLRAAQGSQRTLASALEQARQARNQLQADGGAAAEASSLDDRIDQLEQRLERAHERRRRMQAGVQGAAERSARSGP